MSEAMFQPSSFLKIKFAGDSKKGNKSFNELNRLPNSSMWLWLKLKNVGVQALLAVPVRNKWTMA